MDSDQEFASHLVARLEAAGVFVDPSVVAAVLDAVVAEVREQCVITPAFAGPTWACPDCKKRDEFSVYSVEHDTGARIPVIECRECKSISIDARAERAIDTALADKRDGALR